MHLLVLLAFLILFPALAQGIFRLLVVVIEVTAVLLFLSLIR